MADNLKQLSQDVANAINPAGAPGSILAVNHKSVLTQAIEKSGKYTGLPFKARLKSAAGIIMPGTFVWNGNAMNNTNDFVISVSKYTSDMNDVGHYLSLLAEGTLIHFKDFVGRSVILKYKSHSADVDEISNDIFNIFVSGVPENTNYTYQAGEEEICMIEFFGTASAKDYFQGVEINLFWNRKGKNQQLEDYCEIINRNKFVFSDPNNGVPYFKTIVTKVLHLGIEIKNFANLNPNTEIVIERYKRPRRNKVRDSQGATIIYNNPARYRIQYPYSDNIILEDGSYVYRPMFFPVQGDLSYYRIYAENYFSQIDPPKALGNHHFMTFPKSSLVNIVDDRNKGTRQVPVRRKGYAHCRLRLRTDVTGNGDYVYSDVMAYFKIIDQLVWNSVQDPSEVLISEIKYSYE